jgi:3-oxoacyl-(acyl-carrier-protein) synthase
MMSALITGIGTVSCLGPGVDAFWSGLHTAISKPSLISEPYAHYPVALGYPVAEADLPADPARLDGVPLGSASRLAASAAADAVADAELGPAPPERIAVVMGTAMGDYQARERGRFAPGGSDPAWYTEYLVGSVVARLLGACGPVSTVANACAASAYAIALAADMIASGEADVVLAGGVETHSRVGQANFNRMAAVDPQRCRPFDRHRQGTLFGEGAAMMVLESAEHAAQRGRSRVHGRVVSSGWSCDAHHLTAPDPSGAQIQLAMRRAIGAAGLTAADVGCVIPHGTGTELNDICEAEALRSVFGSDQPPLYSLKAVIGHTAGAAGAMAVLAALLILRHRQIPPNVPLDDLDERCPVRLPARAAPLAGRHVLVNAYAFGGNNISMLLSDEDSSGSGERP